MKMSTKAVKHFQTVLKHKKNVFKACCKAGIPLQGITHDLSKFLPIEFIEYAKYYGEGSPVDRCKKINGYCNSWQHHKGHNPHHYEYWIDRLDEGGVPLIMPYKYAMEMICDYIGAGQTYEKNWTIHAPYEYWLEKRKTAKIHPKMMTFFDTIFRQIGEFGLDAALDKNNTWKFYQAIVLS